MFSGKRKRPRTDLVSTHQGGRVVLHSRKHKVGRAERVFGVVDIVRCVAWESRERSEEVMEQFLERLKFLEVLK